MRQILTTALVIATAVVMLSGCSSSGTSGNAANTAGPSGVIDTASQALDTTAAAPATTTAPAAPQYTVSQQNAITSAKAYLDQGGGFSKAGLIQQLTSKAGEGFKLADAQFALDHIKVNYDQQAVLSAKAYMQQGGFSRSSLIEQLTSSAGEQYTLAQAKYAADQVGLK